MDASHLHGIHIYKSLERLIRVTEESLSTFSLADYSYKNKRTKKHKVLVALSGGRDSVGLLSALKKHAPAQSPYSFYAAYVNHGLQSPAQQQSEFSTVKDICKRLHVPLLSVSIINKSKNTTEEQLRILRYNSLCSMAVSIHAKYIATAHHLEDQYETLFMRLFHKTGWQGLSGIPEIRKIHSPPLYIIRPALDIAPINLHDDTLPYHSDISNTQLRYTRNKVRNKITPVIKKHFPNAVENTASFAGFHTQALQSYKFSRAMWMQGESEIQISLAAFYRLSTIEQYIVLYNGANLLKLSLVSKAFLDECMQFFLHGKGRLLGYNSVLTKSKHHLVWKKTEKDLENSTKRYYHNKEEKIEDTCVLFRYKNNKWNSTKCTVEHPYENLHKGIVYTIRTVPPVCVSFPTKTSTIMCGGEKVNIRDVLSNQGKQAWNAVPVIVDTLGIVLVAGETFLSRTMMRDTTIKHNFLAESKTYLVSISYNFLCIKLAK